MVLIRITSNASLSTTFQAQPPQLPKGSEQVMSLKQLKLDARKYVFSLKSQYSPKDMANFKLAIFSKPINFKLLNRLSVPVKFLSRDGIQCLKIAYKQLI